MVSEGGWPLRAAGCRGGRARGRFPGGSGWAWPLGTPLLAPQQHVDLGSLWEPSRNGSCSDQNRLLRRAWCCASCRRCPPPAPQPGKSGCPRQGGTVLLGPGLPPARHGALCVSGAVSRARWELVRTRKQTRVVETACPGRGGGGGFLPEGQSRREQGLCGSAKRGPNHGSSACWLCDLASYSTSLTCCVVSVQRGPRVLPMGCSVRHSIGGSRPSGSGQAGIPGVVGVSLGAQRWPPGRCCWK